MKRILAYLKPYIFAMSIGLCIKITATLAELAIPRIMSHIIDNVVPLSSVRLIVIWGCVMLVCAGAAFALNVTANRMASKVARDCAESVRRDLFRKTLHLSAAQVDEFTIPSLESRLTTDTYNIHHFINMIQRLGVRAPIMLVGGIAITLSLDPVLSLVMVATLPLIVLAVMRVSKKGVPLYVLVQKKVDKMIGVVREDVQGVRVIKALSKGEYERERYDKTNAELSDTERRAGTTMALTNPLMNLFVNLGLVGVIAIGAIRVGRELSSAGSIIAFIQYFNLVSMAMMSVTRMFVMYTKSSASATRIAQVLDCREEITRQSSERIAELSDGERARRSRRLR